MNNKPLVSIIIPTKNSGEFLENCLKSIKNQTYKNIEIIVVDNNSTDKTKEIAKKYTKLVFNKGNERGAQSNYGITHAKGKYIYRIDGDFLLNKNVIMEAVFKCEKENLDGIAIHNTSNPSISFWAKVRKLERDTYIDDDLIVGLRFYKKTAWKKIKGYNESIIWDDYDFHNRFIKQDLKWGRIKAKESHFGEPKSLSDIFWKSYFYGKEMPQYIKTNPDRGVRQINPIRASYFRHWKSFLKEPVLTVGFLLMLLVKYSGGMLGFIIAIIHKNERS
ncbi:MAG: glycosyltransferase [Actinobacteria bacterium]|nr:glycosyltransferase [Actinomycetota bacterium]